MSSQSIEKFTATRRTALKVAGGGVVAVAVASQTSEAEAATPSALRIAIIGSGYGGAVAARRLGAAGIAVDMIEMGQNWTTMAPSAKTGKVFDSMTSPTERSSWFKTKTDMPFANFLGLPVVNRTITSWAGVLDTKQYSAFKIYRGIGVGGGSLVNGGMAVTPRRTFFEQVLPQVDADEMYDTYFPRANADLGVNMPPASFIQSTPFYQFARTSATKVGKAGYKQVYVPNVYDWDYMAKEAAGTAPASATASAPEVIFGNNYGKKSLDKTILKEAFATGKVNLITLTEVTAIKQAADGTFTLSLKTIDPTGKVLSQKDATYDRVIMGAGSVGTNELLVAAKNLGYIKGLPDTTGHSWGPNGNVMLANEAWLLNSANAVGSKEAGIPAQGVFAWDDSAASVFAEVAPLPVGAETYSNLYLALTNNPNLGQFTWTGSKVDLNWNQTMHAPSVTAAKTVFDKINKAAATFYRTDLFQDNKSFTDYFTYHPLGGMVLGESTDMNGEVKGVSGLFIMDGSLVPGKLGVNPFVTITALAERNMDKLMDAGRFN